MVRRGGDGFSRRGLFIVSFVVIAILGALVMACGEYTPQNQSQVNAQQVAQNRQTYVVKHDVEGQNYNQRLKLADDPTTILWCTAAYSQPGLKPITVPIVGKLTSSNKRPFPTSQVQYQSSYSPELPDAQAMYGTSSEYRYGFTPGGQYWDFYNIEMVCTDQPTIQQREATTLVYQVDDNLLAAQVKARALLQACVDKPDSPECAAAQKQANQIIGDAVKAAGGK